MTRNLGRTETKTLVPHLFCVVSPNVPYIQTDLILREVYGPAAFPLACFFKASYIS